MKERIKADLRDIWRNFRHGGAAIAGGFFLLGWLVGVLL